MFSIGLDIGTTSVCGVLHNAENGEIAKSITKENNCFIHTENSWERVQDPEKLLDILKSVLDGLLAENMPIACIGITGQMHGIVYLDSNGRPVSSLRIWQDGRGDRPYKNGMTYAEFMSEKTGYSLATGYGAVTYFYDAENGLVPENAMTFCTIHDLAAMMLTGMKVPIVHPTNAASMGLFDIKNGKFDALSIEKIGLEISMFPKVCSDYKILGEYRGIPVSSAIGDNQASFIGSVSDMSNSILVNVGTGSQISCITNFAPQNCGSDLRPLLDKSFILAGASLCGGRAYALLEGLFREIAETVTGTSVKSAYSAMDKLMADVEKYDGAVTVNTTFSGTRAQPSLRGSIENIGIDNLSMVSLCDGFMCGMVSELYGMFEKMRPYITEKTLMVGSGNGIRNNKPLRSRFEQTFGMSMVIPSHKEEAAFGASLYALTSAGIYGDIAEAGRLIKYISDRSCS